MDDGIDRMFGDQRADQRGVADIADDQPGFRRDGPGKAGRQPVEDHDLLARVEKLPHHVTADITGAPGHQDGHSRLPRQPHRRGDRAKNRRKTLAKISQLRLSRHCESDFNRLSRSAAEANCSTSQASGRLAKSARSAQYPPSQVLKDVAAARRKLSPRGRSHERSSDPARQAVGGFFDLVEAAVEAEPEMVLAAEAEGGAGGEADIGLLDDVDRRLAGIGDAVDREEQVEGAGRHAEAGAAGGGEHAADQIARPGGRGRSGRPGIPRHDRARRRRRAAGTARRLTSNTGSGSRTCRRARDAS